MILNVMMEQTPTLQYTQYTFTEFKQDAIHDFNFSVCDNRIALLGSCTELVTLELTQIVNCQTKFPYNCASVKLSQKRPLKELTGPVDLKRLYVDCDFLESQALSLDPVYVETHSTQPPEAKLVHAAWSPHPLPNGNALLASLNSYGSLDLYTKSAKSAEWKSEQQLLDVPALVCERVVPASKYAPENIRNLNDFKAYLDRYWLTSFAWWPTPGELKEHTLIAATAMGHILVMRLNARADALIAHNCTHTDMDRICCLTVKDNLLVVGNVQGVVKVFIINKDGVSEASCLWAKRDRMGIQKAELHYYRTTDCYLAVFTKAAHVLTYCLSTTGSVLKSATSYLGGLKLTDLTYLTANTFLLSTLNSTVHHIRLTPSENNTQLTISISQLETDLDKENYHILGIAASPHKNMLTFLLFRNKEYYTHLKLYTRHSCLVSVGKLNTVDTLAQLNALPLNTDMLTCVDFVAAIRLDIINEFDATKYINCFDLALIKFPANVDAELQQYLQIKYLITDAMLLAQSDVQSRLPNTCKMQLELLLPMLEVTHILRRLQYLCSSGVVSKWSAFQKEAADCMLRRLQQQTSTLRELTLSEPQLTLTIENFLSTCSSKMFTELQEFVKGTSKSSTRLCTVSFMPLELSLSLCYCALCGCQALPDLQLLQELFPPEEQVYCTYCHSSFLVDTPLCEI